MSASRISSLSAWAEGHAVAIEQENSRLHAAQLPWACFGIRDPVVLTDAHGQAVRGGDGQFTLFFNARSAPLKEGGETCVGVARGLPGEHWAVNPEPAFQDGPYAALGSALQLAPDHYRLYYSPDTLLGFRMASSVDGRSWQPAPAPGGLALRTQDFGIRRMGLPFVRRIDDRWVMLFEGVDQGAFHLYMAQSKDGVHWEPSHRGQPVYLPANGAWDACGQANPSLYQHIGPDGRATFSILYNGCASPHGWDVGLLSAHCVDGPWQGRPAPLLRRGRPGDWNGGRVEGARLIECPGQMPRLAYFGLPTPDSYAGGQIAFAAIEASEPLEVDREAALSNARAEREYNAKLARRYFDVWDHFPIQRYTTEFESNAMCHSIAPASRVVVLGCGGGRELPALIELGCSIAAVDISPEMLEAGRQRYHGVPIEWIEADLHELPPSLRGFDAAVCLGAVFNYLRAPAVFLDAVRACLVPQGTLLLSAINAGHPSEPVADTRLSDGRCRRLYTVKALRSLLEAAGFSIEQVDGVRFLVDLLPAQWNRDATDEKPEGQLLSRLLQVERLLSEHLEADRAKFILVRARCGLSDAEA